MRFNLRDEFRRRGLAFVPLSSDEAQALDERWRAMFGSTLSINRYTPRWHSFCGKLYPSLEGPAALKEYFDQWRAPFHVFDEEIKFYALCEPQPYPDFSGLHHDMYVTHYHLKWTMAFIHEQPYHGPYFARRPTA